MQTRYNAAMLKPLLLFIAIVVSLEAKASYPAIYNSIGDRVFIASEGYAALLEIGYFQTYRNELETFVKDAEQVRATGLVVDDTPEDRNARIAYVSALRQLETRQKRLDATVLREVKLLSLTYNVAVLELLQANPYRLIREAAQADLSAVKQPDRVLPAIDLEASLALLKSRLLQMRDTDAEQQQCYNDVTAVNYWMVAAQKHARIEEWCDALNATDHIRSFETAARKSCGGDAPLYLEWSKRSMPYRGELRQEFERNCH